jgi:acyl-CoA synthetase (AMP-forming)/AMP-acid ligase II
LGGVLSPANASYSADELRHQLLDSKAKALVTCLPLLSISLEAAAQAGLPKSRVYLIDLPEQILGGVKPPTEFKSVSQILEAGKSLPPVEELKWSAGEGARRTAFLCYSSGTSGMPVGNIILTLMRVWLMMLCVMRNRKE